MRYGKCNGHDYSNGWEYSFCCIIYAELVCQYTFNEHHAYDYGRYGYRYGDGLTCWCYSGLGIKYDYDQWHTYCYRYV